MSDFSNAFPLSSCDSDRKTEQSSTVLDVKFALDSATKRPVVHAVIEDVLRALAPLASEGPYAELLAELRGWHSTSTEGGYFFGSRMKQVWHPSPQFFFGQSDDCKETFKWLAGKIGLTFEIPAVIETPADAQRVLTCLDDLMTCVGATEITGFVRTSNQTPRQSKGSARGGRGGRGGRFGGSSTPRATKVAKFTMIAGSLRASQKALPAWADLYFGDYSRAVSFVAKFAGRVNIWFQAWLRAEAGILAKTGLLRFAVKKYRSTLETLPLTSLFLALASAEFSKRKAFTLEAQKQGFMNEHLSKLLGLVLDHERVGVRYIAYFLPASDILCHTPHAQLEEIRALWLEWMPLFAIALEDQWQRGVWKSARRQMRVLPGNRPRFSFNAQSTTVRRKTGVNSSLYNVVADAWQNGARFLRGIESCIGAEARCWLKTLQLIANDQFRTGGSGAKMDPSVAVYSALTRAGVLPWRVAHPKFASSFNSAEAVTTVIRICEEKKTGTGTWIGVPQLRKGEVTKHHDMICGVVVPPMPQVVYDWICKVIQPYGASGWSGK
ncbi:hypothetical protein YASMINEVIRUS_515 [Yasminevirus sp. GU-2018]|uniref:Uncharacterized protein n=1 Tax=Yasminevirus sp. GU-2018 TaxID=2420051 RepID=A0A5K0U9D9_9VIRU|nr:hypothetical protein YASMINEVIRUS_515 [Yasminevirus sp. GU-2018]